MNELQLERWKKLSLGLARSYSDLTTARKSKLLKEVDNCIEWVVCNGLETVTDWDSRVRYGNGCYDESAGERVDQFLWDNRYEFERNFKNGRFELVTGRFGQMLSSCVRAGFDVAVNPSAGVIGFTVGNLRDVFDGAIPDWVAQYFDNPAALLTAGDDVGVWL